MRCSLPRVSADRLCDPGGLTLENGSGGLGCDVARREAGPAGGQHDSGALGEIADGGRDRSRIVGHDAPLDLEAFGTERLGQHVAAAIVALPSCTPSETVSAAAFTLRPASSSRRA